MTAYASQRALHDPSVEEVLFSEVVAQAAVRVVTGRFDEQKLVLFNAAVRTQALAFQRCFPAAPGLSGLVALGLVDSEMVKQRRRA